MNSSPATIARLVAQLCPSKVALSAYSENELFRGLDAERARLGARPFLVMVYRNDYDLDGLTDDLFLIETYPIQSEAEGAVDALYSQLLRAETERRPAGKNWRLESEGEPAINLSGAMKGPADLGTLYDRTFKIRGGTYDTRYTSVRVVGPFSGLVIDLPLVNFINANFELWSYLVDAAMAHSSQKPTPRPLRRD